MLSIVADRGDADVLIVRGRAPRDVEGAAWACGITQIEHTPDADYGYRFRVTRSTFSLAVSRLASGIDYDNFKGRVHDVDPDPARMDAYFRVWQAMRNFQQQVAARERREREEQLAEADDA